MKKRKKVFKIENQESFRFSIFGISSHEKGYTLTWLLNKHLGMAFTRRDDLVEERAGLDEALRFPVFSFRDETRKVTFFLIQNRSPEGFFLREWPTIDYLLVVPDVTEASFQNNLLTQLKITPGIQTSFLIQPDEISNPERMIIE